MYFDNPHGLPVGPVPRHRTRRPRIAFYSHDTMGMGHLRRNLLIATSLTTGALQAESLIISGAREAAYFTEQAGIDCVTLPTLRKDIAGKYRSRNFDWSLEQTVQLRSHIITAAVANFQPDLFIVDKVPRGIGNELEPILKLLKQSGNTRCVLGLRDVLDEPHVVAREWAQESNSEAIERYFDELWIYGDRTIYDSIYEYQFEPSVAQRCRYTGYLNQSIRLENHERQNQPTDLPTSDTALLALCVVGGGQDGFELAAAFVSAGLPLGWRGIVITGPHMPPDQRRQLTNLIPNDSAIEIIDRLVETEVYLKSAARVVTMGGYNSIMSVLSYCKPSMVVPRITPRREQWIRAKRLEDAGWLTLVLPEQLSPNIIRHWLETPMVPEPAPGCVDLGGLQLITERVASLNPTYCNPL